jgi:hypothetical protein
MTHLLRFIVRQLAWLTVRQITLEETVTSLSADQSHLDADVSELGASFAQVVEELKAQHAAGTPLDFTNADKLVASVQGEAKADAPAAPAASVEQPPAPAAPPVAPAAPVDPNAPVPPAAA